jgi:hypothetical protein
MPIPAPMEDEERGEFVERCMADDIMVSEYPDATQRFAVCLGQWSQKT